MCDRQIDKLKRHVTFSVMGGEDGQQWESLFDCQEFQYSMITLFF
jgi:hypothetical protein